MVTSGRTLRVVRARLRARAVAFVHVGMGARCNSGHCEAAPVGGADRDRPGAASGCCEGHGAALGAPSTPSTPCEYSEYPIPAAPTSETDLPERLVAAQRVRVLRVLLVPCVSTPSTLCEYS